MTVSKVATFVAKIMVAILIGNVLFRIIAGASFDMPYSVEMPVKWLLRSLGHDDLTNADDMEVIVGLGVAVVTTVIGAFAVWGGHGVLRRLAARLRLHA